MKSVEIVVRALTKLGSCRVDKCGKLLFPYFGADFSEGVDGIMFEINSKT